MNIIVNGKPQNIAEGSTAQDLINALTLEGRLALEINLTIIPRSDYASTVLRENDHIEIVHAIGGG